MFNLCLLSCLSDQSLAAARRILYWSQLSYWEIRNNLKLYKSKDIIMQVPRETFISTKIMKTRFHSSGSRTNDCTHVFAKSTRLESVKFIINISVTVSMFKIWLPYITMFVGKRSFSSLQWNITIVIPKKSGSTQYSCRSSEVWYNMFDIQCYQCATCRR